MWTVDYLDNYLRALCKFKYNLSATNEVSSDKAARSGTLSRIGNQGRAFR